MNEAQSTQGVFSPAEVAERLGVKYLTILRLIHAGKLEHFTVGGQYRITLGALKSYLGESTAVEIFGAGERQ